jgi:hypothetical protein
MKRIWMQRNGTVRVRAPLQDIVSCEWDSEGWDVFELSLTILERE